MKTSRSSLPEKDQRRDAKYSPLAPGFTLRLLAAIILALAAAVIIAPLAAVVVAQAGFRFPFPRIFDRVVMVTTACTLLLFARSLGIAVLLRDAFAPALPNIPKLLAGLGIALAVIASLFAAAIAGGGSNAHPAELAARAAKVIPAALLIGILEEGFFRAFLMGGMTRDFGRRIALVLSSVIFALVHLVRSPARYYASGFDPMLGLHNLGASATRLAHPYGSLSMVFGLFLLGMVLGEAFILTGRVYLSAGMHAGFVIGAKLWPRLAHASVIPRFIAGPGPVPLIAAPAAWILSIALLFALPMLFPTAETVSNRKRGEPRADGFDNGDASTGTARDNVARNPRWP